MCHCLNALNFGSHAEGAVRAAGPAWGASWAPGGLPALGEICLLVSAGATLKRCL